MAFGSLFFINIFSQSVDESSRMRQQLVCLVFMLSFLSAKADLINLIRADQCESIAELHIYEHKIRLLLEIGAKDVNAFFPWLSADQWEDFDGLVTEEQLNEFYTNTFIIEADQQLLNGNLLRMHKAPRTYRTSLYTGQVDTLNTSISKEVLLLEIEYRVKNPGRVEIRPPIEKGQTTSTTNIGFVTYHNNLPVNDLRYLSQEEGLNLDWSDPWYSQFDNINLRRHHKNSLMSFLYVEPFEVRHEVLVRIKDLDEWIDLGLKPGDKIQGEDLNDILQKVSDFLIRSNPVFIDDQQIEPTLDKARFVEVNLSGIQIIERVRELDYTSAIIGVIFSYPVQTIPKEVTINWDLWSEKIQVVPCLMTDPAGPMPYDISTEDPVLVWKNYLKNYRSPTIDLISLENRQLKIPYVTIALYTLLGWLFIRDRKRKIRRIPLYAGLFVIGILTFVIHTTVELPVKKKNNLSDNYAQGLLTSLLKNTYRSFDFKKEEQVYDKLALSIEGPILNDVYLDYIKSMSIQQAGGAQASIQSVMVDSVIVRSAEADRIPIHTIWDATGTVGHWGHQHIRKNRYEAIISVAPVNNNWKIVGMDVIEERRIYPLNN